MKFISSEYNQIIYEDDSGDYRFIFIKYDEFNHIKWGKIPGRVSLIIYNTKETLTIEIYKGVEITVPNPKIWLENSLEIEGVVGTIIRILFNKSNKKKLTTKIRDMIITYDNILKINGNDIT
jgi:hypothetical protein